jgi:hypothetical protein
MSYFAKFPQLVYSLDDVRTSFIIADVFRRVRALDENLETSLAYDEYDVEDGETPEIVADKFYDDTTLHWVVLVVNEILDPRYDWHLNTRSLDTYITKKYGAGNEYDIHHYENDDGDIVHVSFAGTKFPISNYAYEEQINESKRRIKILKARFVPQFIQNFERLLNNGR